MKKLLAIVVPILICGLCAAQNNVQSNAQNKLQSNVRNNPKPGDIGTKFVDFTVPDSNGKAVKFSDYVGKGKYVLVDFWASWCGPCKAQMPYLRAVYDKYHGERFDVLGVAVWDDPEDTKVAAREHGIVWNQIVNAGKIPTELYGIDGIPHIMLIGPDGTILARELFGPAIMKAVEKVLGQ